MVCQDDQDSLTGPHQDRREVIAPTDHGRGKIVGVEDSRTNDMDNLSTLLAQLPRPSHRRASSAGMSSLPSLQGSEFTSLRSRANSESITDSLDTLGRRKRNSMITVRVEQARSRRTPSYDFSVLSDDDCMLDFEELMDVQKATNGSFRLDTNKREVVIVPPSPTRTPSLRQRIRQTGGSTKPTQDSNPRRIVPRIVHAKTDSVTSPRRNCGEVMSPSQQRKTPTGAEQQQGQTDEMETDLEMFLAQPQRRTYRRNSSSGMSSLSSLQGTEFSSPRSRANSEGTFDSVDTFGRRKRNSMVTVRVEQPRSRRTPSFDFSVLSDDDCLLDFEELMDVQKATNGSFRLDSSKREVVIVPPTPTCTPSFWQRLLHGVGFKHQGQETNSKRIVPRIVPKNERRKRKYVDAVDDFHMPIRKN